MLSAGQGCPPARHKHSAVVHDDSMWIYGGMTDLNERADLWRFDTSESLWQIQTLKGAFQIPEFSNSQSEHCTHSSFPLYHS